MVALAEKFNGHVHLLVQLEPDEDGYPRYSTEEVDARALGDDLYEIQGIPVFARSLARGDIVRVAEREGSLWVHEVAKESTHATIRVLPWDTSIQAEIVGEFNEIGCLAYWTRYGMVAIDVPEEEIKNAITRLDNGQEAGRWDYDVGCMPQQE